MSLQDLGAIGEVVGGIAVVVSLIYVAYQVRQSARQIEQNSRHLQASMYYAANDAFYRWFALLAEDEGLATLWTRALSGETLERNEKVRVNSLATMLFLSYENNFQQGQLGAMSATRSRSGAPTSPPCFPDPSSVSGGSATHQAP